MIKNKYDEAGKLRMECRVLRRKKISFSYTEIFISSELIFFLILKFCKIKRQNDNYSEEITCGKWNRKFNYFHYVNIYNVRTVLDREDSWIEKIHRFEDIL